MSENPFEIGNIFDVNGTKMIVIEAARTTGAERRNPVGNTHKSGINIDVRLQDVDTWRWANTIDAGERQSWCRCPIARALEREAGGTWAVSAAYAMSYRNVAYRVSRKAGEFIRNYDQGKPVQPATFRFESNS